MTEVSTAAENGESASIINKNTENCKDDSSEESKKEKSSDGNRNNNKSGSSNVTRVWPLVDIKEPHDNDVLYGRGGGTNHHDGNKRYRKLVEERKVDYVNSKRLDKPLVALDIIRSWRAQDPPGRFLKLNEGTGLWHDVGDKKAREKTSQALREKAPLLRQQQREEEQQRRTKDTNGDNNNNKTGSSKAHFNVPAKKKDPSKLKRSALVRDHSLGVDYLDPDEGPVTVDGFTWDQSLTQIGSSTNDTPTPTAVSSKSSHNHRFLNMGDDSSQYASSHREGWGDTTAYAIRGSGTSVNNNNNMNNNASMSPPPPRGNYDNDTGRREHSFTNNPLREASISGPARNPWIDEREKEMTEHERQMHQMQIYYEKHHHNRTIPQREDDNAAGKDNHNFTSPPRVNPTRNPRVSPNNSFKAPVGSYDYAKLAGIMGGAEHNDHHLDSNNTNYPPAPRSNGQYYETPTVHNSYPKRDRVTSSYRHSPEHEKNSRYNASNRDYNHTNRYQNTDTEYIDTYETLGEHHMSDKKEIKISSSPDQRYEHEYNTLYPTKHESDRTNTVIPTLSRPPIVKRETSHQNENFETKRAVKRGAFRRSSGSGYNLGYERNNVEEDEMKNLETTMGQSTLDTPGRIDKRNARTSSSESKRNHSMNKPTSLTAADRMSTVEAIQIEFQTGISPDEVQQSAQPTVERESSIDLIVNDVNQFLEERTQPPRPDSFTMKDRSRTEETVGTFTLDPIKDAPKWIIDKPESFSVKDRISTEGTIGSVDLERLISTSSQSKFGPKFSVESRER